MWKGWDKGEKNIMYLISVYFDDKTNRILQRYIDKIAQATGNEFMVANKVPPHMTISSIEARNVELLIPVFKALSGELKAGEINIVSVGELFPYVIYGGVVMNEYLLDLSQKVYKAYENMAETTISKYYNPLSWLPHVTLGKTLDKEQMRIAFGVLQENFAPINAKVTRIGLAKVNPHEDVAEFELE